MTLTRKIAAALLFSAALASCAKKESKFDKLQWLEGSWEGITGETIAREKWTRVSDNLMKGSAYVLIGTDTVFSEDLKLMQVDTSLFYIVNIQGAPDSTSFVLTKFENDEAVFENPDHDFPKRIVYRKVSNDSVYAYIEGPVDGEVKREAFPYRRTSSPQKK